LESEDAVAVPSTTKDLNTALAKFIEKWAPPISSLPATAHIRHQCFNFPSVLPLSFPVFENYKYWTE
jgi:hypothetical protein